MGIDGEDYWIDMGGNFDAWNVRFTDAAWGPNVPATNPYGEILDAIRLVEWELYPL